MVVPIAMEICAFQVDGGQFIVGDFDTRWIDSGVKFRFDHKPLLGRRGRNQANNDFMTNQRPTAPILRDVAKHAMLNLVPLAGAGGKVADVDGNAQMRGQGLQGHLPQSATAPIAPATIRHDQKFTRLAMTFQAQLPPPPPDRFRRKLSGIVIDAHTDPPLILGEIINAVRNGFAQVFVQKVMDPDFDRLTVRLPFASPVAKFTDQFLLFRVHRDRRLAALLKVLRRSIDVFKLRVAVWMICALSRFAIALQAITRCDQQSSHRAGTGGVPLFRQFTAQARRALASPAQGRLRIPAGRWLNQLFQSRLQSGIQLRLMFAPATCLSHTPRDLNLRGGFAFRQFPPPSADRIRRHPNRGAGRSNAAPPIRLGFRSGPLSARSLVHYRRQRPVNHFHSLDCSGVLHWDVKPLPQKCVNLF